MSLSFLEGTVERVDLQSKEATLNCNGFGFKLSVSSHALNHLKKSAQCRLWTTALFSNEEFRLFGFVSEAEKERFSLLHGLSGIGPKTALALVDALSAQDLLAAVMAEDPARFKGITGIGAKTAEKIIFELKNKTDTLRSLIQPSELPESKAEALLRVKDTIMTLGYSESEILAAFKALNLPEGCADELALRLCLKWLTGLSADQ